MSDSGAFGSAILGGAAAESASHGITVDSVQKKWRDSFTGDLSKWDVTTALGSTATLSSGVLTIASGTTAGGYVELLSKETFTIPLRAMFAVQNTRHASNHHVMEIVSVDPTTQIPDGRHSVAVDIGGAASVTATQMLYYVQNGGMVPLASAASTITTTATYSILELEPFADEAYFHSRALDSTTGRTSSYVRQQQIPDPSATYKVRIRSQNHGAWKNITGAIAGTGGAIRLTITAHAYTGTVWIDSLNGVTNAGAEVRGNYAITVVDVNTIELTGTTFAGTYVTGSGRAALAAAPTAVTAAFQFANVQDYAELTAEITAGRGQIVEGQAIAARLVPSTAAIGTIGALPAGTAVIGDVGVAYRATGTGAPTVRNVVAAATTNATIVKATAGRVVGWQFTNTSATVKYVKLHNVATLPVVGTTAVFITIGIPPNGALAQTIEGGIGFSAGIGLSVVGGFADTDATAVAAGDVVGSLLFA